MAIQATNYDATKEYSVAEIEDVYYPNLLKNGDFQINHRGQGNYTVANGVWDLKYTIDMWYIQNGISLDVLKQTNNTIKLTSTGSTTGYFGQQTDFKISKKHTLVIKVNDISGNVFLPDIPNDPKLVLGINVIDLSSVEESANLKRIMIGLDNSSYVNIEYIDLFEANIVYSHQKEDTAIASIRCQKRIIQISGILNGFTDTTGKFITLQCDKIMDMEGSPVVVGNLSLILRIEGSESKPGATQATVKKETGEIVLTLGSSYSSIAARTISGRFESTIIVTSEPL